MRNIIAAITLTLVLMVGTTFAGTGLLLSDLTGSEPTPCTDTAIVPIGFTAIVPIGFTSIIIFSDVEKTADCAIVPIG